MSGILNSGKLATLLSRLSSTRAGYLDNLTNLDATVSTLLSSGGYTSARAAKLDNLDAAVSGATATVPVSLAGLVKTTATSSASFGASSILPNSGAVACGGTINVYTNIWSVSGDGFITGLSVYVSSGTLAQNYQFRLQIDGSTVVESASNFWDSGDNANMGTMLVGDDRGTPQQIRFTTSFSLAVRCTSASVAANFASDLGYYTVA